MAYETYTTRAIVCGSHDRGDNDRVFRLLTEDAGMVYAVAIGVRRSESKMRYALQDFSLGQVSLVHGRREWRVTGASSTENFYYQSATRKARIELLSFIRIVRRLVHGNEEGSIFRLVKDSIEALSGSNIPEYGVDVAALRLLFALGYVRQDDILRPCLEAPSLMSACAYDMSPQERRAIRDVVKESIAVSHL